MNSQLCFTTLFIVSTTVMAAMPPMPVEVATVTRGPLATTLTASGSLLANEAVMLRPEIIGRVGEIRFREGEAVVKGAELIVLDRTEWRARVAESQAQLELAKLSFDRSQELLKKNLISQQLYDEAAAKFNVAQAQHLVNQERMNKASLRAPFAGVMGLRKVSPGDYVQPGQDLVEIVDHHTLKLDFQVPEIYLAQMRPGLPLTLLTDAYPGKTFQGEVYAVAPDVKVSSRSIAVRGTVKNPDKLLRAGLFAYVTIQLSSREALLIPEQALWPMGNQQQVYKIADGKAQLTPVKIGQRLHGTVEIVDGLAEGDQIVTAGQMKIMPGAAVHPVNTAATTPKAN